MSYIAVTNTFVESATAYATAVNANFNDIVSGLNAGNKDIKVANCIVTGYHQVINTTTGSATGDGGKIYCSGTSLVIYNQEQGSTVDIMCDNRSTLDISATEIIAKNAATIIIYQSATTHTSVTPGALWLDSTSTGNGILKIYANGGWRAVASL